MRVEEVSYEDWMEVTPEDIGRWEYSKLEKFVKDLGSSFRISQLPQIQYDDEIGAKKRYIVARIHRTLEGQLEHIVSAIEQSDDKWLFVTFGPMYWDNPEEDDESPVYKCSTIEDVISLINNVLNKKVESKYIKGFYQYIKESTSLYKVITENDWDEINPITFDKASQSKIISLFKNSDIKISSQTEWALVIYLTVNDDEVELVFHKCDDLWFYVYFGSTTDTDYSGYFKCDDIEGIKNLLEDNDFLISNIET